MKMKVPFASELKVMESSKVMFNPSPRTSYRSSLANIYHCGVISLSVMEPRVLVWSHEETLVSVFLSPYLTLWVSYPSKRIFFKRQTFYIPIKERVNNDLEILEKNQSLSSC